MILEQLYTGCLAEAAYYIESGGQMAIIDPLRETEQYLEMAKENGAKIKYVFETHFHADFVSGHVDLAKKSGAPIVYGPGANPGYDAHVATDGEEFKLGELRIRVLHTPGHTPFDRQAAAGVYRGRFVSRISPRPVVARVWSRRKYECFPYPRAFEANR